MKRVIKFRAWIIDHYEDMYQSNGSNPVYEMVYDLAFEEYAPINTLLGNVDHLMQFTGLHDKNGKEIYEGDFVEVVGKNNKTYIQEIKWSKSTGYNVIINEDRIMGYKRYAALGANNKRCSVIGNIYETPELIQTKKDA